MKTILLLLLIVILIYTGYRLYRNARIDKKLNAKLNNNNAIILDVRTAREYEAGHIDGAINLSLGTIRQQYKELDPEKIYITYCSHGLRSVKAAAILKERGFKQVHNGGAREDLEKMLQKNNKEVL